MKNRYIVEFGYICDGGNTAGTAEPRTMHILDLQYALAMVDPYLHAEWMERIRSLGRRGDYVTLTIESDSREHGTVGRVIKIQKS